MTDTGIPARTVRAADLPEGSVVASQRTVWLAGRAPEGPKSPMGRWMDGGRWLAIGYDTDDGGAESGDMDDTEIDQQMADGAVVLRYGTGQDPR